MNRCKKRGNTHTVILLSGPQNAPTLLIGKYPRYSIPEAFKEQILSPIRSFLDQQTERQGYFVAVLTSLLSAGWRILILPLRQFLEDGNVYFTIDLSQSESRRDCTPFKTSN